MKLVTELSLLFGLRRRIMKNNATHLTREKVLRVLLLLVIGVTFFALVYWGFHRIISYIAHIDILDAVEVGTLLVARLLSMILLLFFSMLLFSNIVTSLSTLYLSSDLAFLLSSPVRFSSVFTSKFVETALNSSSILLIFGLPVFIVCGQEYDASWMYYAGIPLILLPFIVIPASLGTFITMFLVRFFPVKRVQQVLVVFGLILGAGLVMVFRFLRPEQLVNEIGMSQLLGYIQNNRIPSAGYLPSTWGAEAFMAQLEGKPLTALSYWIVLVITAFGLYMLVLQAARGIYYSGWTGSSESRTAKVIKRSTFSERFIARIQFFHPSTRALLIKDIKLFWRDTTQWSQLLMLAALLFIYFFNIKALPLRDYYSKNAISFLNLGLAGFVLASLGARFIYPSTSLEGNSFWVIHSAPMSSRRFVLEKFFIFLLPLLVLAEALVIISNLLLGVSGYMMLLSVGSIFLIALGLTGMGVGLGAIYPKFINENPAQIAMSAGGILYMLLSLLYIGAILVLEAWPVLVFFYRRFSPRPVWGGPQLYLSYTLIVLISLGVTIIPLYLGIKRLQSFEIV